PTPPRFPYPTLFRSALDPVVVDDSLEPLAKLVHVAGSCFELLGARHVLSRCLADALHRPGDLVHAHELLLIRRRNLHGRLRRLRSEEHTSELQSREK